MFLLSVIVPVYNPGKALNRFLDSLKNLDPAIEVIFIDDGCTDGSRDQLESFPIKNLRLISGENLGAGEARNLGLRQAAGRFIAFADADDECRVDVILDLVQLAEDICADVVIAGYELIHEDSQSSIVKPIPIPVDQMREAGARCVLERSAVWGKIYRRDYLNENDIFFPEERGAEDVVFSYRLAATHPATATSDSIAYVYHRNTPGQLTSTRRYFVQGTNALRKLVENFQPGPGSKTLLAHVVLASLPHLVRGAGLAKGVPQTSALLFEATRILGVKTMLGASLKVRANRVEKRRRR